MSQIRIDIQNVNIEDIYPNPWNPNKQSQRVEEATQESIGNYGMLDPITVRPHPSEKDKFEIIDGEHRQRACINLGMKEIPVNVIHELSEQDARKLTIIANETRGQVDKISLSELLNDLNKEMSADELILGLPYYKNELQDLINMGDVEWDKYGIGPETSLPPQEEKLMYNLSCPEEQADNFEIKLRNFLTDHPDVNMRRL